MISRPTRLFLVASLIAALSASESNAGDLPLANPSPPQEPTIKSVAGIQGLPTKIAFGSCGHQDKPQPILNKVVQQKPDLFIYLGDNIYGDTRDMSVLERKYATLGSKPEFKALRAAVPVLSIWDDHDYGWNDAGKEYPFKEESKWIFMDFWKVPKDSPRLRHDGIYGEHQFSDQGKSLQVILLDTRTFRDPLKKNPGALPKDSEFKNAYQPDPDPAKTLLGKEQWIWLQQQLSKPADLRIICTSIQFGHQYNGWESWTNLPLEQKKMVAAIRSTKANGVVFISGDVHWGEISKREFPSMYPLYDVTASGLTEDWHNVERNQFRVGRAYRDNHFGMLEIDWQAKQPKITMKIIGLDGKTKIKHRVALDDLRFPEKH